MQMYGDCIAKLDVKCTNYGKMSSIKGIRDSENRGKEAHNSLFLGRQRIKSFVFGVWNGTPMIPGDVGDDINVVAGQSPQLTVDDQVISMLMVLPLIDEVADIVQDRGVLEPRAFCSSQFMQALRLIEQTQRKARDVQAMDFGCLTPTG